MFDEVVKQATGPMKEKIDMKKADIDGSGKVEDWEKVSPKKRLPRRLSNAFGEGVDKQNENWLKGDKDNLLFESLTKEMD